MEERSDIFLESTEMHAICDAPLARALFKLRPHFGHIGAEYHYMQIGKSLSPPRDCANELILPLPRIHSRRDARDASVVRNAELLANRREAIKFLVRVEVIGIDGIVNRVNFVWLKPRTNQIDSYGIRDREYRGGIAHAPKCRTRELADGRVHMHHGNCPCNISEQARVTGISWAGGGVNDLYAMASDERRSLRQ